MSSKIIEINPWSSRADSFTDFNDFYINIIFFSRQNNAQTLHNSKKLTTVWLNEDYRKKDWYSSGDEIANVNFFYDNIFNHFYALRSGSYRIR